MLLLSTSFSNTTAFESALSASTKATFLLMNMYVYSTGCLDHKFLLPYEIMATNKNYNDGNSPDVKG